MPRLRQLLLIGSLIAAAAFVRLIPHAPNATPLAAVALFGGATLAMPWSALIPLAAMLASDAIIGFDEWPITLSIYGSFVLMVLLGRWLKANQSPGRILTASLLSSSLFYLVTNAAVWKFSDMYPQTLDGLLLSYLYAIPFFRNTLFGDMAYVFSLFLAAEYVPRLVQFLQRKMRSVRVAWLEQRAGVR